MKKIFIVGATGSIGQSTIDIIRNFKQKFKLEGISANENLSSLINIYNEFKPKYVLINNENKANELKNILKSKNSGLFREIFPYVLKDSEIDIIFFASRGLDDIFWILETIKHSKEIFIANKESFVAAGKLIMNEIKKRNLKFIPIDSEHNAIWELTLGRYEDEIEKIIITASGGPFFDLSEDEIKDIKPEDALKHPTWSMGKKITIDSATLFNKGMEVVEANLIFEVPYEKIEVVIHRESIIHSMVEFVDGEVFALLYEPDMRYPIQRALLFPERERNFYKKFDFKKNLTFYEFKKERFPSFEVIVEAGKENGSKPFSIIYTNDILTDLFLQGKISFLSIGKILKKVYDKIERREFSLSILEDLKKETKEIVMKEVMSCI
ncbi:MAG: 1-deoxy-D-xylulose-5-phosphate reductoisomerase [Caldisericia bacterium]|nr:1-deoxy-D-xylulose-5-phosphate reductoisomerase [Caldisericia bacterium]